MSAKSRSQGRTFWLESHQVASSPVCLSPSLSLGKATLRLGLKHPRTFKVKTQTQRSNCSGSRVLWERRKSSAEAHHPENRFHQLLCVSCTKGRRGKASPDVALRCLTEGGKQSDLCRASCRNEQDCGELNPGIQEKEGAVCSKKQNAALFLHSSVSEWHRSPKHLIWVL